MKKEIPMEARLLLAFVLMGIVLWVTPYFMKTPPPAAGAKTAAVQPPKDAAQTAAPAVSSQDADKDAAKDKAATKKPATVKPGTKVTVDAQEEPPTEIQATNEEPVVIETDLAKVTFSNRGAVVTSWILKNFKDNSGKLLELARWMSRYYVAPLGAVIARGFVDAEHHGERENAADTDLALHLDVATHRSNQLAADR
jgi:YidC/Oxa1 family membrane protein insertase